MSGCGFTPERVVVVVDAVAEEGFVSALTTQELFGQWGEAADRVGEERGKDAATRGWVYGRQRRVIGGST